MNLEDRIREIFHEEFASLQESEVDLTLREFGALLDRHEETVRLWCVEGKVPGAYKLMDREWRIPRSSLAKVQQNERERFEDRGEYAATGNGQT